MNRKSLKNDDWKNYSMKMVEELKESMNQWMILNE